MPLPAYARPFLRPLQDPDRFDKGSRRPLRVFLDHPLASGAADGAGEFSEYPFSGGESTGFPSPDAVLRSFLGNAAFEVMFVADSLDRVGAVTFGDGAPPGGDNSFPFGVRRKSGEFLISFAWYSEAAAEISVMAARHGISEDDARAGVFLYRAGNVLEADLIVTGREWLLAERGGQHLASVFSPAEAVALMGLYLRWHELPVIIGGAPVNWSQASMRRSAAYTALPAFERWNQAARAWHAADGDLTLDNLARHA